MVIHPDDSTLVSYLIERDNFDLPVFIDTKDLINKINSFPTEEKFQSFLLDKNNDVIAIGSPAYSPEIGDFYRNIMEGKRLISSTNQTDIKVPVNKVSFNEVSIGDTLRCRFLIENIGATQVSVDTILSSCDCTSASINCKTIAPKNNGEVNVTSVVEGDPSSSFMRTIQVFLKEHSTPVQFKISGTIAE